MAPSTDTAERKQAIERIESARADGLLSASAAEHVGAWLGEPRYDSYAAEVARHVRDGLWKELESAFWKPIPFGTAGRRGRMYPIGPGAINERTIGESAQGLAEYILETGRPESRDGEPPACAIACDTRHRSTEFARLCAEIMVAAGFRVWFLEGHRSTPALAYAVREKRCACGIMISASHNPPSDNAVKVFWDDGGQVRPPHDAGLIARVERVEAIRRTPFDEGLQSGAIVCCQEEIDRNYLRAVLEQGFTGPRDLPILYSPLHGVGLTSVVPALEADGFSQIEVYAPHATPDGDFPNVPGHVANPENAAVFDAPIEHATRSGAELIVASDPDADRLGCAARLTPDGAWQTISGNQIAVLLADFLFSRLRAADQLTPEHYLIKTLVTTDMLDRLAEWYGARCCGDVLTGFKWIGAKIDELGPARFVLGAEEAHGYLAGTYIRDKDGAVAAMLIAELAAALKAKGRTLHQHLDTLQARLGCHVERTIARTMPGAEGMARMESIMEQLRAAPPASLGSIPVAEQRDYLRHERRSPGSEPQSLEGPTGDLLVLQLDRPGNRVAVRPSGTEPKIKFYFFGSEPPEESQDVAAARQRIEARIDALQRDLLARVGL